MLFAAVKMHILHIYQNTHNYNNYASTSLKDVQFSTLLVMSNKTIAYKTTNTLLSEITETQINVHERIPNSKELCQM